jgi:hypothetical protein
VRQAAEFRVEASVPERREDDLEIRRDGTWLRIGGRSRCGAVSRVTVELPVLRRIEAAELSRMGSSLLRTLDRLGKQLQDADGTVKSMKEPDKALLDKISAVKDKADGIKKVFFLSTEEQTMYRKPLQTAYRGGTAAELVMSMVGSISRNMGAPTQTTIDQIEDLRNFLMPLVDKMKEITEKDVPDLNKILAAKNVPYIKL